MANTHSLDLELSSSQYASRADTASLSITGDITIEGWIKLESIGNTMSIAAKTNPGSSLVSYQLFISGSDDKLYIAYSDNGSTVRRNLINMDTAFGGGDVGTWVHIAAAVDVSAKSVAFYKNTVLIGDTLATDGGSTAIHDNASEFSVGARKSTATWGLFFDGLQNNLRVWNGLRNAGEIAANWKQVLTTGPVGSWYAINDHLDLTTNNNDLTASGSPVFSTDVPFTTEILQDIISPGIIPFPR